MQYIGILLLKKIFKYPVFYLAIILLDEASTQESYSSSLKTTKPQLFLTSLYESHNPQ